MRGGGIDTDTDTDSDPEGNQRGAEMPNEALHQTRAHEVRPSKPRDRAGSPSGTRSRHGLGATRTGS